MSELAGQKAVIIGGSRGIGYATAEMALRAGIEVAIAARGYDDLSAAVSNLEKIAGKPIVHGVVDMRDRAQTANFLARVAPFDHLVLPGATVYHAPFNEFDIEKAKTSFDGKFWGMFTAAYDGRRYMRKNGTVILYSGVANRRPVAGFLLGAMIDGALDAATRAMAWELRPEGLRVNCISPGVIETSWAKRITPEQHKELFGGYAAKVPVNRYGQSEDCAKAALYLMSNTFVTGQVLAVDGGIEAAP
jgi:NAD(P)-dependent dehydrogenase (short-subunit alcohol dehydrogenase family)